MKDVKIGVVIPAFKVVDHIKEVISSIPADIKHIIVVDDHCPFGSGKEAEKVNRDNVTVLYHSQNEGVGGAVITGYKKALELGCEIIVKMDGDGQMDPKYVSDLIAPIIRNEADYTKGNRFTHFNLNIINAVVKNLEMPSKYEGEGSSLSSRKALFQFPPKLLKRLVRGYSWNIFSMTSIWHRYI